MWCSLAYCHGKNLDVIQRPRLRRAVGHVDSFPLSFVCLFPFSGTQLICARFLIRQVAHGIGGKMFEDAPDDNARMLREMAKKLIQSGKIGPELQYVISQSVRGLSSEISFFVPKCVLDSC